MLRGRDRELAALHDLVARARGGAGGALVITGGTGLGRTALLAAARAEAPGFQVFDLRGVRAESGIPSAGLHRMLPKAGPGRAHQTLVSESHRRPVLCCVDDAQHLDPDSLSALAFTARRAEAERMLLLFAVRQDAGGGAVPEVLADLPSVSLSELPVTDSVRVLQDRVPYGISRGLGTELAALACGNPLALTELAAELTPEQLGGTAPPPEALPARSRLRAELRARLHALSGSAQQLVLLAVADERLDLETLLRAADRVELTALDEAVAAGLLVVEGDAVRLPDELTRSCLRAETSPARRQAAHRLLVEVLDPRLHRARWLWHQAVVAAQPGLADALGEAADETGRDGDYAFSALIHQRAADLTALPAVRGLRLIRAGRDSWLAGRPERARALLRRARGLAAPGEPRGTADLLRGWIELAEGNPTTANGMLMTAADELAGGNREVAVAALKLAGAAAFNAGDFSRYHLAAKRTEDLRRDDDPPATRLQLDHLAGMDATFRGDHRQAVPLLREVVRLAETADDCGSSLWASQASFVLGDAARAHDLANRALTAPPDRNVPLLGPWASVYRSLSALMLDQYVSAEAGSLEGLRAARATGLHGVTISHLGILTLVSALQGDRENARQRFAAMTDEVTAQGLDRSCVLTSWAFACADLAHGRPTDALDRFRLTTAEAGPAIRVISAPHYVEAAAHCGQRENAGRALRIFDAWARTTGSVARIALSHRCHALLALRGADAEEHFRAAIRLHEQASTPIELAKTGLLYAHWLRRERKPRAARKLLGDALSAFEQFRMPHWIERTRSELRAAGGPSDTGNRGAQDLSPREAEIAQLVAEGARNKEIAARLFISQRTVDHHLRNAFAKLGVRSRVELSRLLR
ncbi:LuxR family transcriptional regulator [Saccharopolyspora taberi]|uniref:LuxR family transcriptional regulator n=1 Tax=Saccharopolyspora taberi TaxID=60895 RepID=A0ABN3VFA8_9PSEU